MAGGGGGSNTTHALLSPDPETLPIGEVSRPATREFLGTKVLQGQPTVAPPAAFTAGLKSTLNQRYGPAIIPWELVAENGLFQPKLILAQKSPKLTPRPDPPEVGTRQPTLSPSGTTSWSPHPTWFPLRSRHQGTTGSSSGVMMPKSSKLASSLRVARPARARPMAHRIGGRTQDFHLSVQPKIRSGLPVGIEIWGRQLTRRGGEIGVPKRSYFGCSK